jgi:hypothetical protein
MIVIHLKALRGGQSLIQFKGRILGYDKQFDILLLKHLKENDKC